MSCDMEHIFEIGQLVDAFEICLRGLKLDDELDIDKIKKIEEEFDKFNIETEDKDVVPIYY